MVEHREPLAPHRYPRLRDREAMLKLVELRGAEGAIGNIVNDYVHSLHMYQDVKHRLVAAGADPQSNVFREIEGELPIWTRSKLARHAGAHGLHSLALEHDVTSHVTISTEPSSGAAIRYQTWLQRELKETPASFADPTVCTEELVIGEYYIWAERDGTATTDRDKLFLVTSTQHQWALAEEGTP